MLNKIDLPSAQPEEVKAEIEEAIGLSCADAVAVSAKTGANVPLVLDQIIARIPPPGGDEKAPLRALIVDSWYDAYQGVVVMFRVMEGTIKMGSRIRMLATGAVAEVTRLGAFSPGPVDFPSFGPGEVGFLCASIKTLTDARVGDTVTLADNPAAAALPGFKEIKPMGRASPSEQIRAAYASRLARGRMIRRRKTTARAAARARFSRKIRTTILPRETYNARVAKRPVMAGEVPPETSTRSGVTATPYSRA